MDNLFKVALRSQTIFSGFLFVVSVTSWPVVIDLLRDYHGKDRFNFNCVPKPNDFTRQRCYDNYTSATSPLLTPLDFAGITYGVSASVWLFFTLMGAAILRKFHQEENRKKIVEKQFYCVFICHICIQCTILTVMMGLFCHYQTLTFPAEYLCSLRNTTLSLFTQVAVNITCNDLRYKEKSKVNIAIIVVMAVSLLLCLLTIIHVRKTKENLLQLLLRNVDEDHGSKSEEIHLEDGGSEHKSSDTDQLLLQATGEGPKRDLKLDEIFTNLIVYEGRAGYDFSGDRLEQLKEYHKANENLRPTRPGDIFDAEKQKILVVGRPGIGKTMFSTKILRDWASDNLISETQKSQIDINVAFLIKLRMFNSINKALNLRDLLDHSEYSTALSEDIWNYILHNPEQVLVIFDGFDEYSGRTKINEDDVPYRNSEEERMPVHLLLKKIVSGKILTGATVLTTTRPNAVSCIRS
ncbi:unnamed protein product, partial [Porites evermanni]